MTDRTILLVLLFAIGGGGAFAGFAYLYESLRLVRRGRRTQGMIIDYHQTQSWSRNSRGFRQREEFYHPVVEFTDDAGELRRVEIELGTGRPEHLPGQTVAILCDPMKPGEVRIDSFSQLWALGLVLSGIGTAFLIAAVIVLFW